MKKIVSITSIRLQGKVYLVGVDDTGELHVLHHRRRSSVEFPDAFPFFDAGLGFRWRPIRTIFDGSAE